MSEETIVIGPGSTVTLHFNLTLEDGSRVDGTEDGEPMTFTLGDGTMIEGLELALIGLGSGETQLISIPPESGFGFPDKSKIRTLPLVEFADTLAPEEGLIMGFDLADGQQVPGTIVSVEKDQVQVDFSHPLAGREVVFSAQILDVNNPLAN